MVLATPVSFNTLARGDPGRGDPANCGSTFGLKNLKSLSHLTVKTACSVISTQYQHCHDAPDTADAMLLRVKTSRIGKIPLHAHLT